MGASKKLKLPLSKLFFGYSQGGIIILAEGTKYSLEGLSIFSGILFTLETI